MTTPFQLNFKIIISKFKHNKYKAIVQKLCSQTLILEIRKTIKKTEKNFPRSTFGLVITTKCVYIIRITFLKKLSLDGLFCLKHNYQTTPLASETVN